MTAAEVLIDSLVNWGVEVIFGLPGDGINGIMEALRTRQDKIRFIQIRAAHASQSDSGTGSTLRRISRLRRAEPGKNCITALGSRVRELI